MIISLSSWCGHESSVNRMDIKHSMKVPEERSGEIKPFDCSQLYHCRRIQLNYFSDMKGKLFFLFTEKLLSL